MKNHITHKLTGIVVAEDSPLLRDLHQTIRATYRAKYGQFRSVGFFTDPKNYMRDHPLSLADQQKVEECLQRIPEGLRASFSE